MRFPAARGVLLVLVFTVLPAAAAAQTFEEQVLEIVNQQRWDNGQLPPLKGCALLDVSSEAHSDTMATDDFMAHCNPDSKSLPWDRMNSAGYFYNYAAENIAAGYSSPAAVMSGWMGSSGHRANILNVSLREIGIGYVYQSGDLATVRLDANGDCVPDGTGGPYRHYWTQNFGTRNSVYPVVIEREAYLTTSRAVNLYVYGSGWAQEMRFRNESDAWSDWVPFTADAVWTLSTGNGTKRVAAEIRNGVTVYAAEDDIALDGPVTAVAGPGDPFGLLLSYAVPNPFRSATRIAYVLPAEAPVRLTVYDIVGRRVAVLVDRNETAGGHEAMWDGRTDGGSRSAPGIYFLRLQAGFETRTTKVLLER